MAALHGTTDPTYTGHARLPTLGRFHAEPRGRGTLPGRLVSVGAVGPHARLVARVGVGHGRLRRWRLHDQRLQDFLGLHAVVGPGLGDGRPQRQAVLVGR